MNLNWGLGNSYAFFLKQFKLFDYTFSQMNFNIIGMSSSKKKDVKLNLKLTSFEKLTRFRFLPDPIAIFIIDPTVSQIASLYVLISINSDNSRNTFVSDIQNWLTNVYTFCYFLFELYYEN